MTVAYPLQQVRSEAAYIAYHLHWSRDEILSLQPPARLYLSR